MYYSAGSHHTFTGDSPSWFSRLCPPLETPFFLLTPFTPFHVRTLLHPPYTILVPEPVLPNMAPCLLRRDSFDYSVLILRTPLLDMTSHLSSKVLQLPGE